MTTPKKLVRHTDTIIKGIEDAFAVISPLQGWHRDTDRVGLRTVKLLALTRTRVIEARDLAGRADESNEKVRDAFRKAYEVLAECAEEYSGMGTAAVNIQVSEQRFDAQSKDHVGRLIDGVTAFSKVLDNLGALAKKPYDPKHWL